MSRPENAEPLRVILGHFILDSEMGKVATFSDRGHSDTERFPLYRSFILSVPHLGFSVHPRVKGTGDVLWGGAKLLGYPRDDNRGGRRTVVVSVVYQ